MHWPTIAHPTSTFRALLVVSILLVLVMILLVVADTAAAGYGLEVHATDGGEEQWFEIDGYPGEDPTVSFGAGDRVDVRLRNIGLEEHNLHLGGPIGVATDIIGPNREAHIAFEVPSGLEPQLVAYWCDVHRHDGMWGWMLLGDEIDASGQEALLPHRDIPPIAPLPFLFGLLAALATLRRAPHRL